MTSSNLFSFDDDIPLGLKDYIDWLWKEIEEQKKLIENLNSRLEEIESEKMTQLENQLEEMFRKW